MKNVTERQKSILDKIIQEYINSARPVPSQILEKKHRLGISPATIRIEMQKLTDEGLLFQPHTSAGRVPTDKGFRFFVDRLFEKEIGSFVDKEFPKEIRKIESQIQDSFQFAREITKILASLSSNLAFSYLFDEKIFWKEGWQEILDEPEFKDTKRVKNFADMIKDLEKCIEDFNFKKEHFPQVKVYIGKENPISKSTDFSLIISQSKFPKKKKATLAILGPKRMFYQKNISLINSLVKILEKI